MGEKEKKGFRTKDTNIPSKIRKGVARYVNVGGEKEDESTQG